MQELTIKSNEPLFVRGNNLQPGIIQLFIKSNDFKNPAAVQEISRMLWAYKTNDWRIELDSETVQQAVGYLQLIGMVTQERAAALLRDGTRAEAYIDDGSV